MGDDAIPSDDGIDAVVRVVNLPAALSVSKGPKTVYLFHRDDTSQKLKLATIKLLQMQKNSMERKSAPDRN
jgi:hypothetical protein